MDPPVVWIEWRPDLCARPAESAHDDLAALYDSLSTGHGGQT